MTQEECHMLDLAAAIDNSFLHAQAAPSFLVAEIAPSDGPGEAEFIRNMEAQFKSHKDELGIWMDEGFTQLQTLEGHLIDAQSGLGEVQVERLLRLSKAIGDRADRSAGCYARMVKNLKKQSRLFAKYSITASKFVASFALRIEESMQSELEFLMDTSDHYRALARQFGPTSDTGEEFTSVDSALSYLKSA